MSTHGIVTLTFMFLEERNTLMRSTAHKGRTSNSWRLLRRYSVCADYGFKFSCLRDSIIYFLHGLSQNLGKGYGGNNDEETLNGATVLSSVAFLVCFDCAGIHVTMVCVNRQDFYILQTNELPRVEGLV